MAEVDTEPDLMVCSDCVDAIEFDDNDLGYSTADHLARMLTIHPDLFATTYWHNMGEDHDAWFSTKRCQGCGTDMAGARFAYTRST